MMLGVWTPPAQQTAGPSSHSQAWCAAVVQAVSPPGLIDLGPGYLQPGLLPVDLLGEAYRRALAEFGSAALSYGANQGALALRAALADRAVSRPGTDSAAGAPYGPDNVLVTGGISQALQLISTSLAAPGQVVFVDRTSYDFGRRIIADCGLRIREVPGDADGMDPQAFTAAVAAERAAGARPAFVYLNPTFHNPTGIVMPAARRRELVSAAAQLEVLIVEDEAYVELAYDGAAIPASCGELAGGHGVIRLRSFAKTLAPGLRLGCAIADPELIGRLVGHGMFVSGGCVNHLSSLAATVLVRDGDYDRHLAWLRDRLRERRDALVGSVRRLLGERVEFGTPSGGFFLWLTFSDRDREPELLAQAREAGVVVAAGSRFGSVTRPSLRLAYSFNAPERLAEAASRLRIAWQPNAVSG